MWPRLERVTTLLSWYLVRPPVRRCVGARYRPVPGAQDEGSSGRLALDAERSARAMVPPRAQALP